MPTIKILTNNNQPLTIGDLIIKNDQLEKEIHLLRIKNFELEREIKKMSSKIEKKFDKSKLKL